jgi:hypothetical protein
MPTGTCFDVSSPCIVVVFLLGRLCWCLCCPLPSPPHHPQGLYIEAEKYIDEAWGIAQRAHLDGEHFAAIQARYRDIHMVLADPNARKAASTKSRLRAVQLERKRASGGGGAVGGSGGSAAAAADAAAAAAALMAAELLAEEEGAAGGGKGGKAKAGKGGGKGGSGGGSGGGGDKKKKSAKKK